MTASVLVARTPACHACGRATHGQVAPPGWPMLSGKPLCDGCGVSPLSCECGPDCAHQWAVRETRWVRSDDRGWRLTIRTCDLCNAERQTVA